mmetsp:Transcript_30414/g.47226  ORF Transcript_30414/g.47226 Transcript_30414/m.47226 type:complete len:540 (+) Transcript_30414:1054-2673(+)
MGCEAITVEREEDCFTLEPFVNVAWVFPADTEEECTARVDGRSGCQRYQNPENYLLWINDEDDCSCRGGVIETAYKWLPGIWKGGVPRQLTWKKAETRQRYEYIEAVSFVLLADWIFASAEEQFLYPVQSQIICESKSITNPVFVLVCDCLDDGGTVCYDPGEEQKEVEMGLNEVCEGETAFVKTPSAQVNFGTNSVSSGCSRLSVAIIYRNWFSAPFAPPPLSFKWEEQKERGVVVNDNGATVGEVLGDGLVIDFETPSVVQSFYVCLRVSVEGNDNSDDYDVPDFGYTDEELEYIYPLGLSTVERDYREFEDGVWYCSSFDYQKAPTRDSGVIRLFAIDRLKNWEDEEDNYVDDETKALCYALGAMYCFVGFCSLIGMVAFVMTTPILNKHLSLPLFCSFIFLILCVFRAVFMFLYPIGTFEFEPLQHYVIFEIPTFLLFSVLIFMIYTFKRLVYKKGFFPGNPTPILYIGWPLVWGLWIIVTIVYSEVILDSDSESACEGRVKTSHEGEEEDTRDLAIAYQSVIIFVTFILTAIFF